MRSRRDAIRSLMPSLLVEPVETFNSDTAASRNWATSPTASASRSTAPAVERTPTSRFNAPRTRRLANAISMVLASHTVQVTTEAKARPINTAFTTGSALRYMPHGLRSRGSAAVATTLSCASAGTGAASHASIATLRNEAALTQPTGAGLELVPYAFPKVPSRPASFQHDYHAASTML